MLVLRLFEVPDVVLKLLVGADFCDLVGGRGGGFEVEGFLGVTKLLGADEAVLKLCSLGAFF